MPISVAQRYHNTAGKMIKYVATEGSKGTIITIWQICGVPVYTAVQYLHGLTKYS